MKKAVQHFQTITKHKYLVMKGCFRAGLYKQGLLHDLSKYSPTEFRVGCKYYQGTRSPNNAEREDIGVSTAWLHHKGRNKHHYEYWIDYSLEKPGELAGCRMPVNYVVEMFVDRVSASKIYMGDTYCDRDPLEYFQRGRANKLIHPETGALLEKLLRILAEEGEDKTYRYIRAKVLKNDALLVRREKIGRKLQKSSALIQAKMQFYLTVCRKKAGR